MSKSAVLSSSIVKKYWMALTGLFLCLFLVGHLLGNLQLITHTGESGKLAFNEYAHFMATNPFIKIMAYLTYFSILFHAIDGILLTIQNKKARPQDYVYNNPGANSSTPSRYMAVLGTLVLVFIVMHMAHFWYRTKVSSAQMPLHTVSLKSEGVEPGAKLYATISGSYLPVDQFSESTQMTQQGEMNVPAQFEIRNGNEFYEKNNNIKMGEGYKDLHGLVMTYFGQTKEGYENEKNDLAWLAVSFYVLAMAVLSFHLWHGFASAFQTLGLRSKKYVGTISMAGKLFAIVVPAAFAIIPILIYLA